MPLKIPNDGELELLAKMIQAGLIIDENYVLKLYQNDYEPTNTSVEGSFVEADFTNYAPRTLYRTSWSDPDTDGDGKAFTTYASQSWTCGSVGNVIYGYYVVGSVSGAVLWAEKFDVSKTLGNADSFEMIPYFSFSSEN